MVYINRNTDKSFKLISKIKGHWFAVSAVANVVVFCRFVGFDIVDDVVDGYDERSHAKVLEIK